jgi:hypothetical protein
LDLYEDGIADSEDAPSGARRAMPRVIASLVVAFFAYLGLAVGGGIGSTAAEANSFSAGKGPQPLYLSLRDAQRGIVADERSVEPKGAWHDGNPALLAAAPFLPLAAPLSPPGVPSEAAFTALLPFQAYLARAPPLVAA